MKISSTNTDKQLQNLHLSHCPYGNKERFILAWQSIVVIDCHIREAFLSLSMAQEKEQLTVVPRGMVGVWEWKGR